MATSIQIGADAIKRIYTKALESMTVDFVCLSSDYEKVVGDWFDTEYATKLYDGIRATREIVPDTTDNRVFSQTKPVTSQVRFLSAATSNTDFVITDTFVALVNFNAEKPEVTVFDEGEVIKTMKAVFELAWKQAE